MDAGTINLNGFNLTHLPEHKRAKYLGRVFQDPMMGTAATMGIEENLALAYRRGQRRGLHAGITNEERKLYREKLATLGLGLEDRMTSKVGLLSGGQRQALTLLMATLQQAAICCCSTSTLRRSTRRPQTRCCRSPRRSLRATITHHHDGHAQHEATPSQYGNRLIMMDSGRVVVDIRGEEKKLPHRRAICSKSSTWIGERQDAAKRSKTFQGGRCLPWIRFRFRRNRKRYPPLHVGPGTARAEG